MFAAQKTDGGSPVLPRFLRGLAAGVAVACVVLTAAGCATTDESDMPWTTQESWEGGITLPGMPTE